MFNKLKEKISKNYVDIFKPILFASVTLFISLFYITMDETTRDVILFILLSLICISVMFIYGSNFIESVIVPKLIYASFTILFGAGFVRLLVCAYYQINPPVVCIIYTFIFLALIKFGLQRVQRSIKIKKENNVSLNNTTQKDSKAQVLPVISPIINIISSLLKLFK